jgi:hypothetical protein
VGACRDVGRTADSTLGTAGIYFATVPDPAVGQKPAHLMSLTKEEAVTAEAAGVWRLRCVRRGSTRRRVATDLTDRDVVTAPVGGAIHS